MTVWLSVLYPTDEVKKISIFSSGIPPPIYIVREPCEWVTGPLHWLAASRWDPRTPPVIAVIHRNQLGRPGSAVRLRRRITGGNVKSLVPVESRWRLQVAWLLLQQTVGVLTAGFYCLLETRWRNDLFLLRLNITKLLRNSRFSTEEAAAAVL